MGSSIPSHLKERNRATVLSLLRSKGDISRADIARESGISVPTVIKVVEYFTALGLVTGAGEGSGTLGRRPQLLRFNPEAAFALGAEYDGVHLSVGLSDLAGGIRTLSRRLAPPDFRALFADTLEKAVAEVIAKAGVAKKRIVGLGLGLPGTVDATGNLLRFAPLVGIAEPTDCSAILKDFERRFGFPAVLENDANAGALGEFAARGLGESDDLLFAVLGRGLGAGIILGGRLHKGPRSFAGEIGYFVFDHRGRSSLERPGWLEERIDLSSFWGEALGEGGPSRKSLLRVADYLSLCIADICVVLDVDRVVLGRVGREPFGPELLALVKERVARLSVLEVSCEASAALEPGVSGAASLVVKDWIGRVCAG